MALGTLDRTPPPFFRQGPSALTKLCFCSALALFLMVADARFRITQPVRATVATMLYPLQRALLVPVEALSSSRDYLSGLAEARSGEQAARLELVRQTERAMRVDQLVQENTRPHAPLGPRTTPNARSQAGGGSSSGCGSGSAPGASTGGGRRTPACAPCSSCGRRSMSVRRRRRYSTRR